MRLSHSHSSHSEWIDIEKGGIWKNEWTVVFQYIDDEIVSFEVVTDDIEGAEVDHPPSDLTFHIKFVPDEDARGDIIWALAAVLTIYISYFLYRVITDSTFYEYAAGGPSNDPSRRRRNDRRNFKSK